jgi:hypothetical protein
VSSETADHEFEEMSADDAALLAELGRALGAADPVPADVLAAAKAAIHLPRLDAELAELLEEAAMAGATRGAATTEVLTFESESMVIDVEVDTAARRLTGRILPAAAADVTLEGVRGQRTARADAGGEFSVEDLPSGPVRLRCSTEDGSVVTTGWFTL